MWTWVLWLLTTDAGDVVIQVGVAMLVLCPVAALLALLSINRS